MLSSGPFLQAYRSTAAGVVPYDAIRDYIKDAPEFLNFKKILEHEPLLKFIYHEKCRFPGAICEDRVVTIPFSDKRQGYTYNISMTEDEYYPGNFRPFDLKGIWLPLEEGSLFSIAREVSSCPLMRSVGGKDYILFLIHPKSEALYADLLRKHKESVLIISALSLSSFRSLLVAVPNESGTFDPAMVKVSLNESIGGVNRILSKRECALSVANTEILQRRLAYYRTPLGVFRDPLSYVPAGYECGMIYRELPPSLNPKYKAADGRYMIPLLSLFGVKNRDLLKHLVGTNAENVSRFLVNYILMPFAQIFINLLIYAETSIEAHGQNLLLELDGSDRVIGLVYRDMGGVNQLISMEELHTLPENLRDPSIYYFESHNKDAAIALEDHFVRRGLFPLTKQLIKCPDFDAKDDNLRVWRAWYRSECVLANWTEDDLETDGHRASLSIENFCRYGYVENLFFQCLMQHLDSIGLDQKVLSVMQKEFEAPDEIHYRTTMGTDTTIRVKPRSIYEFFSEKTLLLLKLTQEKAPAHGAMDDSGPDI